jgi:hypothetical protein
MNFTRKYRFGGICPFRDGSPFGGIETPRHHHVRVCAQAALMRAYPAFDRGPARSEIN